MTSHALARHPAFRRANGHAGMRAELTPELADELVEAVFYQLDLEGVATSCRVEPRRLRQWVESGRRPNAPPLYADFAARFLEADAQCQRGWVHFAKRCALKLNAQAIFAFMDRRWPRPKGGGQSFSAQTEADARGNVKQLLRDPPPDLVAELQEARTVRYLITSEALELPEVVEVLRAHGWTPPNTG